MTAKCLIWDTEATDDGRNGDFVQFNSLRAGGRYRITGTAVPLVDKLSMQGRAKLTTWLVDQRRMGDPHPTITSDTLAIVDTLPRLNVEDRCNRFLLCVESLIKNISEKVRLQGAQDTELAKQSPQLQAWTECAEQQELLELARLLEQAGFINLDATNSAATISFRGWQRLEEMRRRVTPSIQGFVAMWFDESMDSAYRDGFQPAISESGYQPMRIDRKEHINKIDDEIIAEIKRSRFLVADFTSEMDKPRGGVYFEAGFAMGQGIPVIWTCRSDLIDTVHFDTRQFNHITWETPEDLKKALHNRIEAVLGHGPLGLE